MTSNWWRVLLANRFDVSASNVKKSTDSNLIKRHGHGKRRRLSYVMIVVQADRKQTLWWLPDLHVTSVAWYPEICRNVMLQQNNLWWMRIFILWIWKTSSKDGSHMSVLQASTTKIGWRVERNLGDFEKGSRWDKDYFILVTSILDTSS